MKIFLSLSCAVICTMIVTTPSLAQQHSCLEQNGAQIYFCDPLIDGKTIGQRSGGSFTLEGWKAEKFRDYIYYDLGKEVNKGRLSFWVKNISLNNLMHGDNHHLFEMHSINSCNWQLNDYYLTSLRIYSNVGENEPIFGKIKFEYGGTCNQQCPQCNGEKLVSSWSKENWQPERWFHIEMEYDRWWGRLIIDGVEISKIDVNSDCQIAYRYINIPIIPCNENSVDIVDEAIYSHISFTGYLDENPYDAGIDTGSDTSMDIPDAGEHTLTIPVLEDHSVHKWEADKHAEDDTVLDIEGDENGEFNEGFYLKFNINGIPDGYEIDEALIYLYCDYPKYPNAAEGGGGDIYYVEDNDWSENTITWNNKPPFSKEKMDSQGIIKRGNWYRLNVSTVVKGNGTYSFAVMSINKDGGHYLSKEGAKNSGNIPYIKLHFIEKSITEDAISIDTGSDYGVVDTSVDYDSDVVPDIKLDAFEELSHFDAGIDTLDHISYQDSTVVEDHINYYDGQYFEDNTLSDSAKSEETTSGCGCNLIE